MRSRTRDSDGNVVGDFTTITSPTVDVVSDIVGQAADEVSIVIGETIPTRLFRAAESLVALRAAMLVELSYWPEQLSHDASPYNAYASQYKDGMTALQARINDYLTADGSTSTGWSGIGGIATSSAHATTFPLPLPVYDLDTPA